MSLAIRIVGLLIHRAIESPRRSVGRLKRLNINLWLWDESCWLLELRWLIKRNCLQWNRDRLLGNRHFLRENRNCLLRKGSCLLGKGHLHTLARNWHRNLLLGCAALVKVRLWLAPFDYILGLAGLRLDLVLDCGSIRNEVVSWGAHLGLEALANLGVPLLLLYWWRLWVVHLTHYWRTHGIIGWHRLVSCVRYETLGLINGNEALGLSRGNKALGRWFETRRELAHISIQNWRWSVFARRLEATKRSKRD